MQNANDSEDNIILMAVSESEISIYCKYQLIEYVYSSSVQF